MIGKMHRPFVQAREEINGGRAHDDPRPPRQVEIFLDDLDLAVQEEDGDAERETQDRHAAQGDHHVHDPRPAQRLEHEETQQAVDEVEQADDVLGRREVPSGVTKIVVVEASSAMRKAGSPIRQPQITQRTR